MLDKIKKTLNEWKFMFNEYKNRVLVSIGNVLKLGNDDVNQYYDVLNSHKVGLRNLREKLKEISEKDSKSHKKFILSLGEKDENGKLRYENIIEDTYRKIENRNKDIKESERDDAKKILEELKQNSMNIFISLIQELQDKENKNMKISGFRISTLIKILRGDSFCFNTTEDSDPKYIQFDKYVGGKKVKQILQHENSQGEEKDVLISKLHISEGSDLDKMGDCLLKYKKFISYYLEELKPYVVSETWLNDTEFFEYYSSQLEKPEDKKTVRNLALTKKLSISGIELFPLEKEGKTYEERRDHFIKDRTHSLGRALKAYEESGKKLQQGYAVLDLNRLS